MTWKTLAGSAILCLLLWGCNKSAAPTYGQYQQNAGPSAYDPGAQQPAAGSPKSSGFNFFKKKNLTPEEEFEQRMKANAKKYRKQEKMAEKPQYSDPMYFGHKRPPKKRPPGKKKFCKVCGMKH